MGTVARDTAGDAAEASLVGLSMFTSGPRLGSLPCHEGAQMRLEVTRRTALRCPALDVPGRSPAEPPCAAGARD